MEWLHNCSKNRGFIEKHVVGKTFQRREITSIKVSTGKGKPAVVVVGGEVARDWITSAVILNYIHYLMLNTQTDKLLEHYDFYFIPVANPDGYVYSFDQASQQLN